MVQKGKVLGVLLYLGLLACALAFCWQNVLDYLEGNTYYVSTEKKLSLGDLPTVTFCQPRFGISNDPFTLSDPLNVSIYSRIRKRKTDNVVPLKTVLLKENERVQTSFDLQFTLKTLSVMKYDYQINAHLRCFKVSSEWNGKDAVSVDSLSIEFLLEYERSPCPRCYDYPINFLDMPWTSSSGEKINTIEALEFTVWVTSEENSYGLDLDKWFDGKVNPIKVQNQKGFLINGVTEYKKMDGTCSQNSYYECLANRFKAIDFQKESNQLRTMISDEVKNVTKSDCPFQEVCIPIPLPLGPKDNIPICRNLPKEPLTSAYYKESCYRYILDRFIKDQEKHCKKSCKVKEFEVGKNFEPEDVRTGFTNRLAFGFRFSSPLSGDSRSISLHKTVKTEYLVNTWIAMVGTVGGTLGMFVGFSIIGSFEWLMPLGARMMNKLKKSKTATNYKNGISKSRKLKKQRRGSKSHGKNEQN